MLYGIRAKTSTYPNYSPWIGIKRLGGEIKYVNGGRLLFSGFSG